VQIAVAIKSLNIPLPEKSGRKAFQQVFEQDFLPALNAFKPEIIYISAGFDAHAEDPLADLALENADYGWMTQFIKQVAKQHAQGRIISSLEGGYHLPALGEAVCSHEQALLE
jgi:acetoin utilization deacetylase AcuC-like enzyme